MAETTLELKEADLQQWRVIERFRVYLEGKTPLSDRPDTWTDSRRTLTCSKFLCLYLFALVNPALHTLQAICAASKLQRVQQEICGPVSLGSFSEAQHLINPAFLEQIFLELAQELTGPPPKDPGEAALHWLAQDSSLWSALPRMDWAIYGGGRKRKNKRPNRAVRLHLAFNVLDDQPSVATITPGNTCERKAFRQKWTRGASYIGDRYYGEDYSLFGELAGLGCNYLIRLRDEAVITVQEELPVLEADRQARVTRQAWVTLGGRADCRSVRLRAVWIDKPNGGSLCLGTNLPPEELSAELAARVYKRRWQIEFFFRWIKTILPTHHWLAESANGVAIQLYLALIAGVLLHQTLGCRPNKRMMELVQLYQMGWATLEELIAGVTRQRELIQKKAAISKIR